MPKVTWNRDAKKERAKQMRVIINTKAAQRDFRSQATLAKSVGINPSTLSTKINTGSWTCADLRDLDRVLRFSAEELAQLVRC